MAAPKHLEKAVTGRGTNQVLTITAKFTDFHRVKVNKPSGSNNWSYMVSKGSRQRQEQQPKTFLLSWIEPPTGRCKLIFERSLSL